jgi:hypothetical protein
MNCKQTMKFTFSNKSFLILLVAVVFFFMSSSVSFAPTKNMMSDSELSDIQGQALFNITQYDSTYGTGSNNVIRIDLGIDLELLAHMDSMKLGYYNNGTNTGWDEDITNFFWGSVDRTVPLKWNGIFLELGFDNIGSNTTRTLNYIDLGTTNATGQITGTMNTINGLMADPGAPNSGILHRQTVGAAKTITFSNEPMSFVFATKYSYTNGVNSENNLNGIFIKIPNYKPL